MRAIDVVERALQIYGAPVYVRHEIVHNKYVVDSLKAKGVVFIKELSEAPAGARAGDLLRPRRRQGGARGGATRANLFTIDATCPLVTKVHREAQVHFKRGRHVILIGHVGHPEVIGTMGQLPTGAVTPGQLGRRRSKRSRSTPGRRSPMSRRRRFRSTTPARSSRR